MKTMKSASIDTNSFTYWNLLIGLAHHTDFKEFQEVLQNYHVTFQEIQFLDVVFALGCHNNHKWLDSVRRLKFILKQLILKLINCS